jgi:hypothetical protein
MTNRAEAQRRADRIAAFRDELAALQAEGVALDAAQLDAVRRHHEALLGVLTREHDVDATTTARQMSLGMRIASLLGAAALIAAVVSFVDRLWGTLPLWGQIAFLTAAPLISTAICVIAGRIEKTRYVASIFALVACAAFVLQTIELSELLGLSRSPHVLMLWSMFALAIATPWRFSLPFALGVGALVAWVPAAGLWTAGYEYEEFLGHPELVIASAVACAACVRFMPQELRSTGRVVVLVLGLTSLLAMTSVHNLTLLPLADGIARVLYQLLAAAAAVAVIYRGIASRQPEVVIIGSAFAGLFLLTRFVDWWWDWMPKYLFFLILAVAALGWLWGLRLVRRRLVGAAV